MALLQHGTVKFTDKNSDQSTLNDGPMTFANSASPDSLAVIFCTTPFEQHDHTIRAVIESVSTLAPQSISALIDAATLQRLPELPVSIESYCKIHQDSILLADISAAEEFKSENAKALTAGSSGEPTASDVILFIGGMAAFKTFIEQSAHTEQTVLYFPSNLAAQTGLHELLNLDDARTTITVINTNLAIENNADQLSRALIGAVEIAVISDSQFYHWIEGNASQLQNQIPDTLANFIARYCVAASAEDQHLDAATSLAWSYAEKTVGNALTEAHFRAVCLALKTHIAVLQALLPDGADARIGFLLQTLQLFPGNAVDWDSLESAFQTTLCSDEIVVPTDIGGESALVTVEVDQVHRALAWLRHMLA